MAYLAHSLPWGTLCNNFRYRKAQSGPGPQHADLFPRDDKPDQLKSLEYFAQSFEKNLRQHAETHRRKHHAREGYARRAQSWSTSVRSSDKEASSNKKPPKPDDLEYRSPDEIRRQRNLQLRSLQASLSQDWSAQTETRKVYPDYFHSTYSPHMHTALRKDLQSIDQWFIDPESEKEIWSGRPRAIFEQCEVIKTLIAAAAGSSDEDGSSKDHFVDTLFLLVNHSSTRFREYNGLGLSCCNINIGLTGLIDRVTMCFIYLNMLYLYHEQAAAISQSLPEKQRIQDLPAARHNHSDPDRKASVNARMFTYHTTAEVDRHARTPFPGIRFNATPLDRWPAYTGLGSYLFLMNYCCHRHEWLAEISFFLPFFFPLDSSPAADSKPQRVEVDILADPERLKTFVRKLWKILVVCEMIHSEVEPNQLQQQRSSANDAESSQPQSWSKINWEYVVLDAISSMWQWCGSQKIFGEPFWEYADGRWGQSQFHGSTKEP